MKNVNEIEINDLEQFDNTMHKYGRISTIVLISMFMLYPFLIAMYLGVGIDFKAALGASIGICALFVPSSIVEVITYAPMLGTGATYLAFITGNLTNLKIPCCMNARKLVGTEFGTKENEIVSTLSVAISSLTTIIIIALGVMLLVPLGPIINSPVLEPAFSTVVPALFGSLGYQYIKQAPKVAVVPLLLISILCFAIPSLASQVVILIAVAAIASITIARILYKKGKI